MVDFLKDAAKLKNYWKDIGCYRNTKDNTLEEFAIKCLRDHRYVIEVLWSDLYFYIDNEERNYNFNAFYNGVLGRQGATNVQKLFEAALARPDITSLEEYM